MSVKKMISLLLITVVLATPVTFGVTFNDLNSVKWAETSIQNMALNGYIDGYTDGSFKPEKSFTRAELISIINKMNGFNEEANINFKDVSENHWANNEIKKAVKAGFVSGYSDGTFRPNELVSREQVATILNNLYHLENTTLRTPIKDLSKISPWAVQAVVNCMANGIMGGYPDGTFGSKNNLTRAEGVVALNKIVVKNILTTEKWIVSNEVKEPVTEIPNTETPVVIVEEPSSSVVLEKLSTVEKRMRLIVKPLLSTELQLNTCDLIVSSINQYLQNTNYSTAADVEVAKGKLNLMTPSEYDYFKSSISNNILYTDMVELNKIFKLVDRAE